MARVIFIVACILILLGVDIYSSKYEQCFLECSAQTNEICADGSPICDEVVC